MTFKTSSIMILVLCALLVLASLGNMAVGSTFTEMLIDNLTLGPATSLNLNTHGKSSDKLDEKLLEIYRDNGYQPFWLKNGQPDQRGKDIFAALRDSSSHGLDPASYLVKNISQFWAGSDTSSQVKLDIVLTLGMIRYVADQREGRLLPRLVDPKLFATARDAEVDWQTLFQTAFKTPDMAAFLANQAPPFRQYRLLQKTLAEYRNIAATGGWPSIPQGPVLKPNSLDSRIQIVRNRLVITGDLGAREIKGDVFDHPLVEAVKKFQKRHNLSNDGVIGKQTLAAMNVSVDYRIQQIIINMERYRWLKQLNDERLVVVNIAGFEAAAGTQNNFDVSMPVIVGNTYHETPVFNDTIEYVVFNPYWNVPPSIARKEMLPNLQKDPGYLKKHNMRIFEGWKPGAVELDATTIDWGRVTERGMNGYHIRQDPGPDNALGSLKIIFPNEYSVYLHDTPAHNLFKKETRALSHGCIRMGKPAEMASWVLGGEEKGWSVERVKEVVASRKQLEVTLDQPVPVHILYRTVFIRPDEDAVYFYNDIYGRDKLLAQALLGTKN